MMLQHRHLQAQSASRPRAASRPRVACRSGMLGKLMQSLGSSASKPASSSAWFSDNAPTWEELRSLVEAKKASLGLGLSYYTDPENTTTNPFSLKRTFGKTEPIRVKLYRDHAAWCPYCHKVWLQLEEKQIPYVMEKINMRCYGDKPREFMSKVPSGLLPVLELDGRVVTESAVIMNLLEEAFPDNKPLMPTKGSPERERADNLMRLERRIFSDWLNWLCSDWNQDAAQARFVSTLSVVEKELSAAGGPFFLGTDLSLVDITFVPMLERMVASLAYYKGYFIRGTGQWPALEAWFNALEQRPTYLGTRSDFYTHCHDLPPQLGGCGMTAEGEPVAAVIDGQAPGAWRLPLPPLSATSLPEPYSLGDNPEADTLEVAAKMVGNKDNLIKFALRGPGKPGPRPVMAPLADPTAIPAEEYTPAADMAMRHVVHALVAGVDVKQASPAALKVVKTQPDGPAAQMVAGPVIAAAEYLRDRVGVPRDLRFPAARQMRAHLNWLIDNLNQ